MPASADEIFYRLLDSAAQTTKDGDAIAQNKRIKEAEFAEDSREPAAEEEKALQACVMEKGGSGPPATDSLSGEKHPGENFKETQGAIKQDKKANAGKINGIPRGVTGGNQRVRQPGEASGGGEKQRPKRHFPFFHHGEQDIKKI
ncbi:MAG: hypothetical protein MMC33_007051 [Icmadophila ericetorum]|nr:hypothetical protein [Icmadophila ericetorum]